MDRPSKDLSFVVGATYFDSRPLQQFARCSVFPPRTLDPLDRTRFSCVAQPQQLSTLLVSIAPLRVSLCISGRELLIPHVWVLVSFGCLSYSGCLVRSTDTGSSGDTQNRMVLSWIKSSSEKTRWDHKVTHRTLDTQSVNKDGCGSCEHASRRFQCQRWRRKVGPFMSEFAASRELAPMDFSWRANIAI